MTPLYIRADADAKTGAGHIMRCVALGQAWRKMGGDVTFLSRCQSEGIRRRVRDEGFDLIDIPNPFPHPDDLQTVSETLLKRAAQQRAPTQEWVVIDGYHFTGEYQRAIRDLGARVMVIDDDAHLAHYPADILLNQNINASDLSYSFPPETLPLMGPDYVLLRQEFLNYERDERAVSVQVEKILVTLGGGDSDNVTSKVIDAIERLGLDGVAATIILGPANPHVDSLNKQLSGVSFNWRLLHGVNNMPEWMAWADLVISAAGGTCWELCYMGAPALLMVIAENQRRIGEGLDRNGSCISLGWHEDVDEEKIYEVLRRVVHSPDRRRELSNHARQLVDGRGVKRIMASLIGFNAGLRKWRTDDRGLLWQWANDPETRRASLNPEEIPWEEHVAWFEKIMANEDARLYILASDQTPLGQIRFERQKSGAWLISYVIAPAYRGLGLGVQMVQKGLIQMRLENNPPMTFLGIVKKENGVSRKIFIEAGFSEQTGGLDGQDKACVTYQLKIAREDGVCED